MLERGKNARGVMEIVDTESLVPVGHMFRQMDAAVNFEKLYEIVEPLHSEDEGRRSIDPVVLSKSYCCSIWTGMRRFERRFAERRRT